MNFKEEIHKIPFVRILAPLISGILIQKFFPLSESLLFSVVISATLLLLILFLTKKNKNTFKIISDSYKYILIFFVGFYLGLKSEKQLLHINQYDLENGKIIAIIIEPPVIKEKSIKAVLNISHIKTKENWEESEGKILVYFEKESLSGQLKLGDKLLIATSFDNIAGPKNPNEFDYQKYMAFHLIAKQAFIKSDNWKIIEQNKVNSIGELANNFRNNLLNIYERNGIKNSELAVISALTLGYKDKLDANTKKTYSASGAMHVLAVSGLHIGIIFLIFNTILSFLPQTKTTRILKPIFLILILWFYAIMTGLPPSAFRATIMFSLVVVGNSLSRKSNIYNTLAASAFILLLINPNYLFELGFQLSYLAVIGIVFFQPRISSIFKFKNIILSKSWDLIAVSVAAQIATAPIALFYFHQFPLYFILANLIVLPLAFILIYISLLLFTFSFWPVISIKIAWFENILLKFLNESVLFIEEMPLSVLKNISIDGVQLSILYVFLIIISIFIISKKAPYLISAIILLVFFAGYSNFRLIESLNQNYFIVYNINNTSAYNFIRGKNNLLLSNINIDERKIEYHLRNHWINIGVEDEKILYLENFEKTEELSNCLDQLYINNILYKKGVVLFNSIKIFLPRSREINLTKSGKIKLDYIVISRESKFSFENLISNFEFNKIVFDSSIYNTELESFVKKCKELSIPYYSVKNEGAFIVKI